MKVLYELNNLRFSYGTAEVLRIETLSLVEGQLVAIAGPNGAGKSTLLSVLAGLRRNYAGECLLDGREIRLSSQKAVARLVSFVPQTLEIAFPFTVEQVVLMGRTPYCDGLFESAEDHQHAERAMRLTDCADLRRRDFRSLSGGERQRVILAAALAQTPQALLLDEPTTFLDLSHQLRVYDVLKDLARSGLLVVSVTHDLNLARGFAGRTILLDSGRLAADGSTAEVLQPENIRSVFQVEAELCRGEAGKSWIRYGP